MPAVSETFEWIVVLGFAAGVAICALVAWWSLRDVDLNADEPEGFR